MEAKMQKWGNSLALRISCHLAKELNLQHNSRVQVKVEDGTITITPLHEKETELNKLLSQIQEDHLHGEEDFGSAQGKEVW